MKKCMRCGEYAVKNPNHDYCYECWEELEDDEFLESPEDSFEEDIHNGRIYTCYIMFYGKNKVKIGYTADLNSRIFELKRSYPNNKFVYFREFIRESEARRFEAYLKKKSDREIVRFVSRFQDKIKKVDLV